MTKNSQNIAVIGAGIMGLSAAFALKYTCHNATTACVDADGFPPEKSASIMAGGMLSPYSEIEHMPDGFIRAGLHSIELWKQNAVKLHQHIAFKQNGSLLLCHPEDTHILERFRSHLHKKHQSHYRECNQTDIHRLEPDLAPRFKYGLYLKNEAYLDPALAMTALSLELWPKVSGYYDLKSDDFFDWIVDCRGYAAAQDDPELRGVKGEILIVRNTEFQLSRPVRLMHPRYPLYIVPREDNIFMIGATSIESADKNVSLRSVMELTSALYSLHPSFGEAQILETKAGIRPAYPDNLPRIKIENNIIRCNGLFRHGFLLAPVMAQCVADYIAGRENEFMNLFTEKPDETDHQRSGKELHRAA